MADKEALVRAFVQRKFSAALFDVVIFTAPRGGKALDWAESFPGSDYIKSKPSHKIHNLSFST